MVSTKHTGRNESGKRRVSDNLHVNFPNPSDCPGIQKGTPRSSKPTRFTPLHLIKHVSSTPRTAEVHGTGLKLTQVAALRDRQWVWWVGGVNHID